MANNRKRGQLLTTKQWLQVSACIFALVIANSIYNALSAHPAVFALVIIVLLVGGGLLAWAYVRRWLNSESGSAMQPQGSRNYAPRIDLRTMDPHDFERLVAHRMGQMGFHHIRHVGGPGDHGVDIHAFDSGGSAVIVQCKRYNGSIGPATIRELAGARQMHGAHRALLVTTGVLSQSAEVTAQRLEIEVFGGDEIDSWLY